MGACVFVLTQERIVQPPTFRVLVENVPCGSTGVTCTKAVTIEVFSKRVTLVRGGWFIVGNKTAGAKTVENLFGDEVTVCDSGLVVQLTFRHIGLVVVWDGCEWHS